MRVLLLIPSLLKTGIDDMVAADRHPIMDYYALAEHLRDSGMKVDLVGYAELLELSTKKPLLNKIKSFFGIDAALAYLGYLRRSDYDVIFTNGENISIPLSAMLGPTRPCHVSIGHRLSAPKKRLFFQALRVDRRLDTIFVYGSAQKTHAQHSLGIAASRLRRIAFHADTAFYRPLPNVDTRPRRISSAGLEWRDYPTLIAGVSQIKNVEVKLGASSPWSKGKNETVDRPLPSFITARRYEYSELRDLYASSAVVAVPLYETDFPAGITTILEAMAMGKAVVATRTTGQNDTIIEGHTGLYVAPGDANGWKTTLENLLEDPDRQRQLGLAAREWVKEHASLTRWTENIALAIQGKSVPEAFATIN